MYHFYSKIHHFLLAEDYRLTMCINILKCVAESPSTSLSSCMEEAGEDVETSDSAAAQKTSCPETPSANDNTCSPILSPRKSKKIISFRCQKLKGFHVIVFNNHTL